MRFFQHFFTSLMAISSMMFISCNKVDYYSAVEENTAELQTPSRERDVNVTPSEAATLAELFANSNDGIAGIASKAGVKRSSKISSTATVREDGQDLMYVFNYVDGGWVIVGSTREYYPILAYSDEGKFELKEDMGPVDVWLDETKVSIKNSSSLSDEEKSQMRSLWSHYEDAGLLAEKTKAARVLTKSTGEDYCWERIDSLQAIYGSDGWTFTTVSAAEQIFTDLGLTSYYADICYSAEQNYSALNETLIGYKNPISTQVGPVIGTQWHPLTPFNDLCPSNCYAGYGPVAVAQVMKYYEEPATMSWGGVTFGWSSIPAVPNYNSTDRHAFLIRYLWNKLDVHVYSPTQILTTVAKVQSGLDSMGYSASIINPHSDVSVKNQLIYYSRPVIMYGVDSDQNIEHFWVCEGAKETYYNRMLFYTENQPNGAGVFTQGMYTRTVPGDIGGGNPYLSFYMNWGMGSSPYFSPNGWYGANYVVLDGNDLSSDRKDIFVSW